MIELIIQDYCQECPEFTPDINQTIGRSRDDKYIDAKEVEKRIDIVIGSEPKAWDKKALKELKMYIVHAIPTADVVEVVRCKDCIHNHTKSWNQGKRDNPRCHFTDLIRSNEFYCGFGERAEK